MTDRILIVDDEVNLLMLFEKILEKEGFTVFAVDNGWRALEILESEEIDLVVSDLMMPGLDGLGLLAKAKTVSPASQFIVLTGVGTVETAVQAMKGGAFDYLQKPVQREEFIIAARRAISHGRLRREVERLRGEVTEQHQFGNLLGKSKPMRNLFKLLRRVAESTATVLIQGESGTGKELIAKAVHYSSPRRAGAFVAVDCGAVPDSLIESELFGHVKGAFTGAVRAKKGLFEEANGGTLFLDEIGNISQSMQAKLLRALQESEIRPVGGNETRKVDVRIIAAGNTDLREAVAAKRFRDDLYYRLAVVSVRIPPLRERREDIPLLADHFLKRFSTRLGKKKRYATDALASLVSYNWPGNVRELENTIERAVILSEGEVIRAAHIDPDAPAGRRAPSTHGTMPLWTASADATAETEREAIMAALEQARGNKSLAARALKISRGTLYNKLREYHIEEKTVRS